MVVNDRGPTFATSRERMPDHAALKPAVRAYVGAVVLLALGGFALVAFHDPRFPGSASTEAVGLLTFLGVGFVLELAEHRLAISASGSISFIVYIGGSLVFGPTWGGLITATCFTVAHALNKRPPLKIAFNVAQQTLGILMAAQVYIGLGGQIPPTSLDGSLVPFGAMVLAFFTINSLAVSAAVALSERRGLGEVWLRNTWSLAGYDLVASTLGLAIAVLYSSRYGLFGVAAVVTLILFLRHVYTVNLQLQAANREMLDVMVKSIEARDPYTSGHSQRVADLARLIARELGLGLREIDSISTAALLHDVGKIYEEFAPLLRKEQRLSSDEYSIIQTHPIRSAELVAAVSNLRGDVEKAVRHHHENFDGSGYPDRLSGDAIPIGARIIMVADTVDAMISHRPYRCALNYADVVPELQKYSGVQFDPEVVRAFLKSPAIRSLLDSARRSARIVDPRADLGSEPHQAIAG
jgi:putative nucleotidyltransferase with HDIG domain